MAVNNPELHKLKNKIIDYKRFSFIFLFISAFLNIGSALPFDGKTEGKAEFLLMSSFAFLIISLLFYWRLRKAKRTYEEHL